jgi:hypothetical protein
MATVRGDHCKGAGAVVRLRRVSSIVDVAMPSMLRTASHALFSRESMGAPSGSMCVSWPPVTRGITVKHAIPIASDPSR